MHIFVYMHINIFIYFSSHINIYIIKYLFILFSYIYILFMLRFGCTDDWRTAGIRGLANLA